MKQDLVMGLPDFCIQGLDIQYPVNSLYTVPVCMLRQVCRVTPITIF